MLQKLPGVLAKPRTFRHSTWAKYQLKKPNHAGDNHAMRDPRRIKRICELLQSIWEIQPDQRFGQLLENLTRFYNLFPYHKPTMEPYQTGHIITWSQEDDVTERLLEDILEKLRKDLKSY
jgi:hypothetical protein